MSITPIEGESDCEFLEMLYVSFQAQMYATASRYTHIQQDREDIVQDSVERLCGKVQKLRHLPQYALSAYIMLTVKNTALNFQAHQSVINRHTISLSDTPDRFLSQTPLPEKMLEIKEGKEALKHVWHLLSEQDRELLYQKYILRESNEELAKQYHCQKDSVRMLLFRARQRALGLMEEGEWHRGKT